MMWGVFDGKESAVHVAPLSTNLMHCDVPHELTVACVCNPRTEYDETMKRPLVIHHELTNCANHG